MDCDLEDDLLFGKLPHGCLVRTLTRHSDERGTITEVFTKDLELPVTPVQWNAVTSTANTLRGVHVHHRHADVLHIVEGEMHLGLHDLATGQAALVRLRAEPARAVYIPPGVAHGFHLVGSTVFVYGLDHRWSPDDEAGCHWADPGLGIPWRASTPLLSQRDSEAGSLSDLRDEWFARA